MPDAPTRGSGPSARPPDETLEALPREAPRPRLTSRACLLVVLGYTLLTLALTWPLAANFTTAVAGGPGDTNVYLWNAWWVKHALLDLKTNPFHTDYLFYPKGVSLVFHALTFLNALVSIPLDSCLGPLAAHNTVIVATFALSGLGAWLLVRRLTGDSLASFVAGAVFAFCPYKFAHLPSHANLVSTQWIPFYVLFLLRMTEGAARSRVRSGLAAGLFLVLTAYTDYYYLYYLLVFTCIYVAYLFFTDRKRVLDSRSRSFTPSPLQGEGMRGKRVLDGRFLKASLWAALVFALGFAPLVVLAARDVASGEYAATPPNTGFSSYVADLLGFITPSVQHPLFGTYVRAVAGHFHGGGEGRVFLGFTVIALSAFAIVRLRRSVPPVRFWTWTGLAFLFLSLGPYLRVLGRKILPLPIYLLKFVPIISGFRVSSRFNIMTMLCCAVLVGFALAHLPGPRAAPWKKTLLALAVLALILFEYLALPVPMWDSRYHPVFDAIAADSREGVLLEVPLGWGSGTGAFGKVDMRQVYYQTVHHKKLFSGVVSRFGADRESYHRSLPFVGTVLAVQEKGGVPPDLARERALAADAARRYGIRYVVVHRPYINSPVHRFLLDVLPLEEIARDRELAAYRVKE